MNETVHCQSKFSEESERGPPAMLVRSFPCLLESRINTILMMIHERTVAAGVCIAGADHSAE